MVRVVEEEPHPEDSVNFLQPAKLSELYYSSGEEENTVAMIETSVEKVEPLNMPFKIGNMNTTLLVDSRVRALFSTVHSHRRWYKAALPHSG